MPRRRPFLALTGLTLVAAAVPAVPSAHAAAALGDRVLRIHSRGADVRQLQRALTALDVPTDVDGQFGPGTRRAVRTYERAHDLRADGRVSRRQGRGIARRAAAAATDRTPAQALPAEVPGTAAVLPPGSLKAQVPADAPDAVKAAVVAANEIAGRPYRYGGGHGDFDDSAYDCSGAVSYALHGAGLLKRPLASGDLMSWGRSGEGDWITVHANGGHAYVVIAGLRFDTSGSGGKGPRWRPEPRSGSGFTARHPAGL